MIDFQNIKLPFAASDLLSAGIGLLAVVGGFVLLAMAFRVVPQLINLISGAFARDQSNDGVKRDRHGNRVHWQSPEAKAWLKKNG